MSDHEMTGNTCLFYGRTIGGGSMDDIGDIGVIIRQFAQRPERQVESVDRVLQTIRVAEGISRNQPDWSLFPRVIVPEDVRYRDHDCGGTAGLIHEVVRSERFSRVISLEKGDSFCGALNRGVWECVTDTFQYALIMSPKAREYLTAENVDLMREALSKPGALVAGLVLPELADSIREGRIANTFAMWYLPALVQVGGFDLMARQGFIGEDRPNAGVEEIAPLIRLVETFGPCIVPVEPAGEAALSLRSDSGTHGTKIDTKLPRQQAHASALGVGDVVEFLKGGVLR